MQILMLFIALNLHFSIFAQVDSETAVVGRSKGFQELKLESKLMKREMPYRVILPVGYEVNADNKFPVVYLLHGLTGHFDNWTNQSKIVEYARDYDYIIVTPEGNDGWYSDSATVDERQIRKLYYSGTYSRNRKKISCAFRSGKPHHCRTFDGRLRFVQIRFEIS